MPAEEQLKVGLQVSLAPMDAPHARSILPHQLRAFADQVDDIVLSVDSARNLASRYRTEDYETKSGELGELLEQVVGEFPAARVCAVDYSPAATLAVSKFFGGVEALPQRAADGSPFHAYLHGMHSSTADVVIHLDSDVFLGGRSRTWVNEALALLNTEPRVFAVNPLPGPPCADGKLRSQEGVPYGDQPATFEFPAVSTRILMIDKRPFQSGELRVPLSVPTLSRRIRAALNNTPPVQALENCLSDMMHSHGLIRVDMLGSGDGMWTLHPDGRSPDFYAALPSLLRRVEEGDIPEGQRGYHDVNDAFFDWSSTRALNTRPERVRRNILWARAGMSERIRR